MSHQIFISYSSKDQNIADKLLSVLESQNIKCWIAPRDIVGGVEYGDIIDEAILNCKVVVIIFSAHSQQSQWVRGELNLGFTHKKAIIPYRIDNTPLYGAMRLILNDKHWINATPPGNYKWNDLLEAVAIALEKPVHQLVPLPYTKKKKTVIVFISIILTGAIVSTVFAYKNHQKNILFSKYQILIAQGDSLQQTGWQNFQPALAKYQTAIEMERNISKQNLLPIGQKMTALQAKIDTLFKLCEQAGYTSDTISNILINKIFKFCEEAGDEYAKLNNDYGYRKAIDYYQNALILKETENVRQKLKKIKNYYQ